MQCPSHHAVTCIVNVVRLFGTEKKMIIAKTLSTDDDLPALVQEINQASWDDANEISAYSVQALVAYLGRPDNFFVVSYGIQDGSRKLLGVASARLQLKPYGNEPWLYVDEVDVCADERQKGAGKAMMHKLIEIARESDCEEVWLGTEVDNQAANALYASLEPDEVAQFIGYAYTMQR